LEEADYAVAVAVVVAGVLVLVMSEEGEGRKVKGKKSTDFVPDFNHGLCFYFCCGCTLKLDICEGRRKKAAVAAVLEVEATVAAVAAGGDRTLFPLEDIDFPSKCSPMKRSLRKEERKEGRKEGRES